MQSREELDAALASIPQITDEELAFLRPSEAHPLNIERYAEYWSIRQDNRWIYFRGGPTPGHVCSHDMLSYQWRRENLLEIGPRVQCSTNPGTFYRRIVASAP